MKLEQSISKSWVVALPIAVALTFSVVAGASSAPIHPAVAYSLLGDTTNTGSDATTFTTTSASSAAWKFRATGNSATALVAECPNGTACWGIQGTGTQYGVYGAASNTANANGTIAGVNGNGGSTGSGGTSYGGYFAASNNASGGKAYGVYASGATAGLYAVSSNSNGVYAKSNSSSGNGVYATGSGSSFYGLWGDVEGGGYGVVGTSKGGGNGVYGTTDGSSAGGSQPAGVYGYNSLSSVRTSSATNSGVFGTCTNCNGVFGTSANYVGVRGTTTGVGRSTFGGYFSAVAGTGIFTRTTRGTAALHATNGTKTAGHYAGLFDGNVRINGNYVATGTKSAVVATSRGDRLMYSEEATQNYFSDQGTATLKRGRAVVKIDSLFAETVDLTKPYMVFITPLSFDTAGLGVGNRTAKSFEVRELGRGTGTFSFSWRVTALRKGYANQRMARLDDPSTAAATNAAVLPTRPSPADTPVGDASVAPPTLKAAPKAPKPAVFSKGK